MILEIASIKDQTRELSKMFGHVQWRSVAATIWSNYQDPR